MSRGEINNRDRAMQINDFRGLRYGTITPTDIDGFLDLNDNVFVFIELKYGDAELPYGQRLALERLCDAAWNGGKESYLLIGRHDVSDCATDVDVATAMLVELRRRGERVVLTNEQRTTIASAISAIITLRHPFGA